MFSVGAETETVEASTSELVQEATGLCARQTVTSGPSRALVCGRKETPNFVRIPMPAATGFHESPTWKLTMATGNRAT